MSGEKKCIIDGCEGGGKRYKNGTVYFFKGLCNKHLQRFQRRGDPHFVKSRFGQDRLKHPLYVIYKSIKARCYNKNHKHYNYYGGRGITICSNWLGSEGFTNFCNDMGERPDKNYSIDRIDNNGNYDPANCKRSTRHEQARNKSNNNEYVGVYFKKNTKSWISHFTFGGKVILHKEFKNKQDAINARIEAESKFL